MRSTEGEAEERLADRLRKVEALANDKRAPKGERSAAKGKAKKLREQLHSLRGASDAAYQGLVKDGRAAAQQMEQGLWQLGDLATLVKTKYGQARLQQYADDIGVPYSTLKAARTTARAWPQKASRLAFSVAQALNTLKDRADIAAKHPNLTREEARKMVRERRPSRKAKPNANEMAKQVLRILEPDPLAHLLVTLVEHAGALDEMVLSQLRSRLESTTEKMQGLMSKLKKLDP